MMQQWLGGDCKVSAHWHTKRRHLTLNYSCIILHHRRHSGGRLWWRRGRQVSSRTCDCTCGVVTEVIGARAEHEHGVAALARGQVRQLAIERELVELSVDIGWFVDDAAFHPIWFICQQRRQSMLCRWHYVGALHVTNELALRRFCPLFASKRARRLLDAQRRTFLQCRTRSMLRRNFWQISFQIILY